MTRHGDAALIHGRGRALIEYLRAVYPALPRSVSQRALRALHESLDLVYVCEPAWLRTMVPPVKRCGGATAPLLPMLSAGIYYRARGAPPHAQDMVMLGNFTRYPLPVARLATPLWWSNVATDSIHSCWGSRAGPQPSWTDPLSLVRYPLAPNGLVVSEQMLVKAAVDESRAHFSLDPARLPALSRLLALRDGGGGGGGGGRWVEVQQWGGHTPMGSRTPGTWANVWRGSGVFMRVKRPLVSLSKATAIVEMLHMLGEQHSSSNAPEPPPSRPPLTRSRGGRGQRHNSNNASTGESQSPLLLRLARTIGVHGALMRVHASAPPHTPLAASLAKALFTTAHPCELVDPDRATFGALWRAWRTWAAASTPEAVVNALLHLGDPRHHSTSATSTATSTVTSTASTASTTEIDATSPPLPSGMHAGGRFALHWLLGICGKGPWCKGRHKLGWDRLLAVLACLTGRRTVVLAASPNDNGLLHQEVVDFDLPYELLPWPTLPLVELAHGRTAEAVDAVEARGGRAADLLTQCLRPMTPPPRPRGAEEAAAALRATAQLQRRVREAWAVARKFALLDPTAAEQQQSGHQRSSAEVGALPRGALPCVLTQGREDAEGACDPDLVGGKAMAPSDDKVCFLGCEGQMSREHSSVASLLHAYRGQPQSASQP